jgi:hypothetical protein
MYGYLGPTFALDRQWDSRLVATRYGFSNHSRVRPALVRLQSRGLVDQRDGSWYIVDPLFGEWLRRASPLADPPTFAPLRP